MVYPTHKRVILPLFKCTEFFQKSNISPIAHWTYLETQLPLPPDWGQAAQTALELIFPQIVVSHMLLNIERLLPLALSCGFDIHISRCKM